jgi:hypothetical protein
MVLGAPGGEIPPGDSTDSVSSCSKGTLRDDVALRSEPQPVRFRREEPRRAAAFGLSGSDSRHNVLGPICSLTTSVTSAITSGICSSDLIEVVKQ